MDLKELGLVDPKKHWYYQHKALILRKIFTNYNIKADILVDVGAGSGFFCESFMAQLASNKGYCVDPYYSNDIINLNSKIDFVRKHPKISADLYLFIDVLEHVDYPQALLGESIEIAKSSSRFLISVPAFQILWSGHDVFLGHKKRYSLSEIEALVIRAGLLIEHSQFIFAPIFPLVALIRFFKKTSSIKSDMKQHGPIISHLLKYLLWIETLIPCNRIFGTSIVVLAKKPSIITS